MSHINGQGYGDCHLWVRKGQANIGGVRISNTFKRSNYQIVNALSLTTMMLIGRIFLI